MILTSALAGATLRDRTIGSVGAIVGMALTYLLSALVAPAGSPLPLLVAPMGASAVLVFAVPASPLAQPWSVVGGNVLSVLVGVTAARVVPILPLAIGVGVGGAILVMSVFRCLHPPGGAAALTAVIGGPAIASAGYGFALVPVGANAIILTVTGMLFHRLSGHSYPHRPAPAASEPSSHDADVLRRDDIDRALAELGETFDVGPDDLDLLLRRAEVHAARRRLANR